MIQANKMILVWEIGGVIFILFILNILIIIVYSVCRLWLS